MSEKRKIATRDPMSMCLPENHVWGTLSSGSTVCAACAVNKADFDEGIPEVRTITLWVPKGMTLAEAVDKAIRQLRFSTGRGPMKANLIPDADLIKALEELEGK